MNIKNLVPPLELCKLIPAGEFEDSSLMWFSNYHFGGFHVEKRGLAAALTDNGEIYPAPTLEEIIRKIRLDVLCGIEHHGDFYVANRHIGCFEDERAATAALKLWLKLKGIEYAE